MTQLRRVLIALLAVLMALLALVDASVRAPGTHKLSALAGLWPGHPDGLTRMLQISASKAAHDPEDYRGGMRRQAQLVMKREPLSAVAPLVLGAAMQIEGESARASQLYKLAAARKPRDPAARLLYADSLLRRGAVGPALEEMIVLTKISAPSSDQVVKAIADYARTPGAAAKIRPVLARNPAMRDTLLTMLAADPSNLALIEYLADGQRPVVSGEGWPQTLINALVASNRFADARQIWSKVADKPLADDNVFNPTFAKLVAPKPFDWELGTGPFGLAEFETGGGLKIVYYGREDGLFAKQLLVLRPGRYRFSWQATGRGPFDGLGWRFTCLSGRALATIPFQTVDGAASTFVVQPDCPASWVELVAAAPENERLVETVVQSVRLERTGP